MRGSRVKLADAPDTVGYGSHGLCAGCYRAAGPRAAAARGLLAAPANQDTLDRYLALRRLRLARTVRA